MIISFEGAESRLKKEDILNKVTEEQIYKRFCSKFPSRSFKSPFRGDKNASFGFFQKRGSWWWKDLGGNGDTGSVWDYVMRDQGVDYQGAINLIAREFGITTDYMNPIIESKRFNKEAFKEAQERKRTLIQVIRRPYDVSELKWWNRILITPALLEWYFMRAASEVWLNKRIVWTNREHNPIYYYLSPVSGNIKCYRPFEVDKRRKWLSNQDPLKDVQGYYQCDIKRVPQRPLLLVKSLKEVAFLRVFGFNAMANTAEHTRFHVDFIRHIKKYCYPIIYLGDNDWPGMRALIKIEQNHQIPGIIIPRKWGSKDPTDLWLANYRKVYDLLNLINDYTKHIRIAGGSAKAPRELRHS